MARRPGINRVTLIGNLGEVPELRHIEGGSLATCWASLAVEGERKDPEGNVESSIEWFRLVFFGRQAEIVARFGQRGVPVFVEGKLQTRPYADRNGVIRTAIEVVVDRLLVLGKEPDDAAGA